MTIPRVWFLHFSVTPEAVLVGLEYKFDTVTLLGSSCRTTLDVGVTSERSFRIFPNMEGSDLVLVMLKSREFIELGLIHLTRGENGKIQVRHDPIESRYHAHPDVDFQLYPRGVQVRSNGIRFTSDPSVRSTRKQPVKYAYPDTILRFITGRIDSNALTEEASNVRPKHLRKLEALFTSCDTPTYTSAAGKIEEALVELDGVISVIHTSAEGSTVLVRLFSETANRFYFWRESGEDDAPAHPCRQNVPLLGSVQKDGTFTGEVKVVKQIVGLSRVKNGGESDLWPNTIESEVYARGIAMTLVLDVAKLQSAGGTAELVRFLRAAMLLEGAEYINLSADAFNYESTSSE